VQNQKVRAKIDQTNKYAARLILKVRKKGLILTRVGMKKMVRMERQGKIWNRFVLEETARTILRDC